MTDEETGKGPEQIKIPGILPILPLHGVVVFPKMILPLEVGEESSLTLIDEAMAKDRQMGIALLKGDQKGPEAKCPPDDYHAIGTSVVILRMAKTEGNRVQLLVQGIQRIQIMEPVLGKSYIQARVKPLDDHEVKDIEIEAMMANLAGLFERIVKLSPFLPQEFGSMAKSITEAGVLADMIASIINSSGEEKQKILEMINVRDRLRGVTKLVNHQVEILELGNKIQSQIKTDMDKGQREYYLRQQMKAIREELGEGDEGKVELDELRAKIEKKNLPEEAKKEALRELERLSRMHPSSAEYTVSSTYLDWMTALPWQERTPDNKDIRKAKQILDDDHFGLAKPKKRIIEYLAVRKLKEDMKGPILCLVGPPGTGKTSLGNSMARALGRKFIRLSLGGVHDEAEIRGHRRTYVGALPGRILQGIRRAESNNPVFMLDEVDKLGSDFRGDPSSALLEVLDPEQNFSFVDHYLDVPFDLSRVIFITTANILDTIPPALRDRLEIIELRGYTQEEKYEIAKRYLIPRQVEANGLTAKQIKFSKAAVNLVIAGYTRESGVRNLEREIGSVCRGVASTVAEGRRRTFSIAEKDVQKYLGPVRITSEALSRKNKPGIAIGMAWTPVGGEILFVEATAMKGRQRLTLTGQLGDVMKESATAALSFIRSNASALGIAKDFFEDADIHIHVPAGATQKDGPSAGVTMLTAMTSLFSNRKIKRALAMTGEITLRGLVLPVGGIKEKVIAAHRAGVREIILPKGNKVDMNDIPPRIRKEIRFHFVEEMLEVLKIALESGGERPARRLPRRKRANG